MKYRDFLVLHIIATHPNVTQRQLFDPATKAGYINTFIEDNRIDKALAIPVSGVQQLTKSIARLRSAGLLLSKGEYKLTHKGMRVAYQLQDDCTKWPIEAEVGDMYLENMVYSDL